MFFSINLVLKCVLEFKFFLLIKCVLQYNFFYVFSINLVLKYQYVYGSYIYIYDIRFNIIQGVIDFY